MPYHEVMSLPMRAFWFISGTVERLQAEASMRSMQVHMAGQSSEGFKAMQEHLEKLAPPPFKFSGNARMEMTAQADPDAASKLRMLAG